MLALVIGLAVVSGPAMATHMCQTQLDALTRQWDETGLLPPSKPGQAVVTGRQGHQHTGPEVEYMRQQINRAAHLCSEGKEHEAMLHMDVVRAFLKLPEIAHPPGHRPASR
jgi:hypothetical protein